MAGCHFVYCLFLYRRLIYLKANTLFLSATKTLSLHSHSKHNQNIIFVVEVSVDEMFVIEESID
jgi:hypothetical protein